MKTITCENCGKNVKLYKHNGTYMSNLDGLVNALLSAQGQVFKCASCMAKENPNVFFAMKELSKNLYIETKGLEKSLNLPSDYQMACELNRNFKPYAVKWYMANHDRLVRIYVKDYLPVKKARLGHPSSFEATVKLFKGTPSANARIHDAYGVKPNKVTVNAVAEFMQDPFAVERVVSKIRLALKDFENAFMASPTGGYGYMDKKAQVFNGLVFDFNNLTLGLGEFGVDYDNAKDVVLDLCEQLDSYYTAKAREVELVDFVDEAKIDSTKTDEILNMVEDLNKKSMSKAKKAETLLNRLGMKAYVSTAKKYKLATKKFYAYRQMANDLLENKGDALKALEAQAKTLASKIADAHGADKEQLQSQIDGLAQKAVGILNQLEAVGFVSLKARDRANRICDYADPELSRDEVEELLGGSLYGTLFENY